ncbi:hypothetical protein [Salinispira pacifica]|uniref:Uncharacterized protein n=1 Tax=Salinispira pacifica TaxID=1307761 RepID=V5WDX2_9SPIO|nr:hypothetical protein [Salinispira pacifica]AHC13987.1 hypothetical protein L21SP2_0555 [Salinispira pacifica]
MHVCIIFPRGQKHFSRLPGSRRFGIGALVISLLPFLLLSSCADPLAWPEAPLYSQDTVSRLQGNLEELAAENPGYTAPEQISTENDYPESREEAIDAIRGNYGHFDVVAYQDRSTKTPMNSFIVSYGYTEFVPEPVHGDIRLVQQNRFLFADYILNQGGVETSFDPSAVQAIKPRNSRVELYVEDGLWRMYRPETPVLLGVQGDPDISLEQNIQAGRAAGLSDERLFPDDDGDGNPGVTVKLKIAGIIHGELYIARREIYRNHLTLHPGGIISGHVEDLSEQYVIDANMKILRQQSESLQFGGPGLNPIYLIPLNRNINSAEQLLEIRDRIFPPSPEFVRK